MKYELQFEEKKRTKVTVLQTLTCVCSFPASASDWYGRKVQRGVQRVLDSDSAALVGWVATLNRQPETDTTYFSLVM